MVQPKQKQEKYKKKEEEEEEKKKETKKDNNEDELEKELNELPDSKNKKQEEKDENKSKKEKDRFKTINFTNEAEILSIFNSFTSFFTSSFFSPFSILAISSECRFLILCASSSSWKMKNLQNISFLISNK